MALGMTDLLRHCASFAGIQGRLTETRRWESNEENWWESNGRTVFSQNVLEREEWVIKAEEDKRLCLSARKPSSYSSNNLDWVLETLIGTCPVIL